MKERPLLFSAPMIQAILAGNKTQTRRIVKPDGVNAIEYMAGSNDDQTEFEFLGLRYGPWIDDANKEQAPEWLVYCSEYPEEGIIPIGQGYGVAGDQIWVKETWQAAIGWDRTKPSEIDKHAPIFFPADGSELHVDAWDDWETRAYGKLRPSIFMPRWASRIQLEITCIRIERLQDCSEADAVAEGIKVDECGHAIRKIDDVAWGSAKGAYAELWESINGPGSWAANPWVWVLEFRVLKPEATK